MNDVDRNILSAIESGIPLTAEPFNEVAAQLGISPEEVVSRLHALQKNGTIRRFGASMKPKGVGFSANALIAWKVPKENVREAGESLSKYREISHCYEREVVDGKWEYNLYVVMHAKNREDIQRLVKAISIKLAIDHYRILYSTRNLKEAVPPSASPKPHEKPTVHGNGGGKML